MVFWNIVYQFAHDIKYHIIKDSIRYFIYLAMSTRPRCASQVCKLSGLTHDNAICKWVTRRRLTSWHLYQCGWKWIPSFKQIKNLSTFYFCFLIFKRAPLFTKFTKVQFIYKTHFWNHALKTRFLFSRSGFLSVVSRSVVSKVCFVHR